MLDVPRIFLSYAPEDETSVAGLYDGLSKEGFQPWMKSKNIIGGENKQLSIEKAIRNAHFFLICLSKNSINQRGSIQREIRQALDFWQEKKEDDIYLIPVRLTECEVPDGLKGFLEVDLFADDGWARLLEAFAVGMDRYRTESKSTPIRDTSLNFKENISQNSIVAFQFNTYLENLYLSDEETQQIQDLINWCLVEIIKDQFEEGSARGAWGKRYRDYIRLMYQDSSPPDGVSTYESISISRIIAINLLKYAKTMKNRDFQFLISPRISLLREYLLNHYSSKMGGFGLYSHQFRGKSIKVDLRHTTQAALILDEMDLDSDSREFFRQVGAYLKQELCSPSLKQERVITLSVIHRFLTCEASDILLLPDRERRGLQKQIEGIIVQKFDESIGSWDIGSGEDDDPVRFRIDNILFVLALISPSSCLDPECGQVLTAAMQRLIRTDLKETDNQTLALPLVDGMEPDIGATLQLIAIAISNRDKGNIEDDYIRRMLLFCSDAKNRRNAPFCYSWYLSSIFEIACMYI